MSDRIMKRVLSKKDLPFDVVFPSVPGRCAYCGGELRGKQKRWCKDECSVEAWREVNLRRGVSGYVRQGVLKRDKGVCAGCGADCEKISRVWCAAQRSLWEWGRFDSYSVLKKVWAVADGQGNFWQADHIVEVKAGGQHLLENLQTLCTICHKEKTKSFVRSLAAIRNAEIVEAYDAQGVLEL
jgi:5-methylcytosine-specific restriction endonuclease McrA